MADIFDDYVLAQAWDEMFEMPAFRGRPTRRCSPRSSRSNPTT